MTTQQLMQHLLTTAVCLATEQVRRQALEPLTLATAAFTEQVNMLNCFDTLAST
jgi:hypothetical protein